MNQADFRAQNPYASFGMVAADAPAADRLSFIRRTYLHVALAVYALVMLEVMYFTLFGDTMNQLMPRMMNRVTWFLILAAFMAVGHVANKWAMSDTSASKQYMGLGLYVLFESFVLAPLLWIANHYATPVGDMTFSPIAVAAVLTLFVFAGLTLGVFLTRADFSFLGPILGIGGMLALGLIAASFFFPGMLSGVWFPIAMVVLVSGSVLYSTSNVLHHYRTTQHVAAALALFASLATLFWYILQIVLASSRRN
ncbi:Bax inhibitor-1/YccA family protein [Aeoliella mucimassa]|uniref:Inhibitor of apoptosis-promoting Bax1 n=1 Tax=Aeoliella mucimassa TaxID=2527972 RepID=A0A518AQU4_9BACT|nr:Bax inhibitor-1 family protein [Aeoliella mucimassa]QDU57099.1 Inhibitor of apoptosis-promoting Bax1 [Aeoliella mucimassa]